LSTLPGKFRSCKLAFTVLPRTAREARPARYSEVLPCLSGPLRHRESYKHTGSNVKSAAQRRPNPDKTAADPVASDERPRRPQELRIQAHEQRRGMCPAFLFSRIAQRFITCPRSARSMV